MSDPESGIASSSGCGTTTISADTLGQTLTCSATNGVGLTGSQSVTVKIDSQKPTIAFGGNAGTYAVDQTVDITCTVSDPAPSSGIASSTCPTASAPAYTFPVGANTLTASATDNAGNASTATTTFTVVVTNAALCNLVSQWVANKGVANSLCVKLQHDSERAFENEVNAQRGKWIPASRADLLIALARQRH